MEGGNIFSNQLSPRNYIVATPGGYEQSAPRYGDYNHYTPIGYPIPGYNVANHQNMIYEKQERETYACEEEAYPNHDVKPNIVSTTSAFNVVTTPQYSINGSHSVSRDGESIDANMTASGTFHASTYSAFSPFASDHSSPLGQSPTQATQSPLI